MLPKHILQHSATLWTKISGGPSAADGYQRTALQYVRCRVIEKSISKSSGEADEKSMVLLYDLAISGAADGAEYVPAILFTGAAGTFTIRPYESFMAPGDVAGAAPSENAYRVGSLQRKASFDGRAFLRVESE